MNKCCDQYIQNSQPRKPLQVEFFSETHTCPKCGQKLNIQFQRIELLGGNVEYVAISAELISSSLHSK
jgi:hypothetical protein